MSVNADHAPFDPGLQVERTQLAWTRTALGFCVNAALLARLARDATPSLPVYVVAAAWVLLGSATWAIGRAGYVPRADDLKHGRPVARGVWVRRLGTSTSAVAVVSLAALLTCCADPR